MSSPASVKIRWGTTNSSAQNPVGCCEPSTRLHTLAPVSTINIVGIAFSLVRRYPVIRTARRETPSRHRARAGDHGGVSSRLRAIARETVELAETVFHDQTVRAVAGTRLY